MANWGGHRSGSGRKRKEVSEKKVQFTLHFSPDLAAVVLELPKGQRNAIIELILRKELLAGKNSDQS